MSVARFIADQRTNYRVPHRLVCALLGVSLAWFYKWWARAQGPSAVSGLHTGRDRRSDSVDRAVAVAFKAARGLHGSPRLWADLRDDGWEVSEKTVADSMRRQGLIARRIKRRNGLTRQDRTAAKFPDLLKRDFTAPAPNARWVGDMTEIPTVDEHGRPGAKLYLATVIDLYSRRLTPSPRMSRWKPCSAGYVQQMIRLCSLHEPSCSGWSQRLPLVIENRANDQSERQPRRRETPKSWAFRLL